MNKHIKQFERESNIDVYGLGLDRAKWETAVGKFAELIVRECCEVAHCNFHVDGLTLGVMLKEHFGVEE